MQSARIIASLLLASLLIAAALFVTATPENGGQFAPRAQANENDSGGGGESPDAPGNFFFPDPDEGFVPCGKRSATDSTVVIEEPCNICHAAEMGQNIINFLIRTVVPALAILIAAWGGFEMITAGGSETRYQSGRARLTKVVVGVLIVLVAWIAVNFFLYTFFKEEIIGTWYSFDCSVEAKDPVTGVTPDLPDVRSVVIQESDGTFPADLPPGSGNFGARLSHAAALSQLQAAGVQYDNACGSRGSLNGIYQAVISEIVWLKSSCNCPITVTEGTGAGCHSTNSPHYQGVKIDIDDSPGVTQYIYNNSSRVGSRGGSYPALLYMFPGRSAVYARESTHWDIQAR